MNTCTSMTSIINMNMAPAIQMAKHIHIRIIMNRSDMITNTIPTFTTGTIIDTRSNT